MLAGARPKLIMSASESSSLPTGDEISSKRAKKPSRKSNTAATSTHQKASSKSLMQRAKITAAQPESRLQRVRIFGKVNSLSFIRSSDLASADRSRNERPRLAGRVSPLTGSFRTEVPQGEYAKIEIKFQYPIRLAAPDAATRPVPPKSKGPAGADPSQRLLFHEAGGRRNVWQSGENALSL